MSADSTQSECATHSAQWSNIATSNIIDIKPSKSKAIFRFKWFVKKLIKTEPSAIPNEKYLQKKVKYNIRQYTLVNGIYYITAPKLKPWDAQL